MYAANANRIRFADGRDAETLKRLAARAGQQPLVGRVLLGQINWEPAAALSLADGRVIADPAHGTDHLVATMRIRAGAIWAYESEPSLRGRLLAAFTDARGESTVTQVPEWRDGDREQERVEGYEDAIGRKAA